jgi:hypothetical protein
MKYALKPSSLCIDVQGSNKIIYFNDEKSLFKFFHLKMQQDLMKPVVRTERYENWHKQKQPNPISATDVTGIYSLLVSSNVDFQFLSWSSRVTKFIHDNLPNSKNRWEHWKVLARMRSLPCNWTLYQLKDHDGGMVMQSIGWGNFFRIAKRDNLLQGIDITYRLPETE